MAPNFTRYKPQFFDYVVDLVQEEIGPYFPNAKFHRDDIQRRLNRNKTLLIQNMNKTIGLISYRPIGNQIFLDLLAIEKNAQHKGIGRKAIQLLIGEAEHMGKSSIFLFVSPSNMKARKAYEKYGFQTTSTHRGNIVMEKGI